MTTLSDNEALMTVGQILAGFLKEYLPSEDRWSRFVSPALANTANAPSTEVPLDELDLSALLQVFLGNRDYLRGRNVFRTTLPFNCAFCVRNMRNSRAHQSHATAISDDERLFDLNLLRRFTLLIDNRATKPGLIDDFLAALDGTIVEISKRCFGDVSLSERPTVDVTAQGVPIESQPEFAGLIGDLFNQMDDGFEKVGNQLEGLKSLISQEASSNQRIREEAFDRAPALSAASHSALPIIDHLNAIDAKIDRLLGVAATAEAVEVQAESLKPETYQDTELMSGLEAKAALRSLRAQFATDYPNTDPTHALLRQSMVDLILANRIDTVERYEAVIPEVMKRDTDPAQTALLPKVFEVVKRLR